MKRSALYIPLLMLTLASMRDYNISFDSTFYNSHLMNTLNNIKSKMSSRLYHTDSVQNDGETRYDFITKDRMVSTQGKDIAIEKNFNSKKSEVGVVNTHKVSGLKTTFTSDIVRKTNGQSVMFIDYGGEGNLNRIIFSDTKTVETHNVDEKGFTKFQTSRTRNAKKIWFIDYENNTVALNDLETGTGNSISGENASKVILELNLKYGNQIQESEKFLGLSN